MKRREQLRLSVLLVDAQREPSELDASLLDFLAYYEVPTLVVATKTDKLKPAQLDASLAALADALELPEGQPLPFSAVTKDGRKELCERDPGAGGRREAEVGFVRAALFFDLK